MDAIKIFVYALEYRESNIFLRICDSDGNARRVSLENLKMLQADGKLSLSEFNKRLLPIIKDGVLQKNSNAHNFTIINRIIKYNASNLISIIGVDGKAIINIPVNSESTLSKLVFTNGKIVKVVKPHTLNVENTIQFLSESYTDMVDSMYKELNCNTELMEYKNQLDNDISKLDLVGSEIKLTEDGIIDYSEYTKSYIPKLMIPKSVRFIKMLPKQTEFGGIILNENIEGFDTSNIGLHRLNYKIESKDDNEFTFKLDASQCKNMVSFGDRETGVGSLVANMLLSINNKIEKSYSNKTEFDNLLREVDDYFSIKSIDYTYNEAERSKVLNYIDRIEKTELDYKKVYVDCYLPKELEVVKGVCKYGTNLYFKSGLKIIENCWDKTHRGAYSSRYLKFSHLADSNTYISSKDDLSKLYLEYSERVKLRKVLYNKVLAVTYFDSVESIEVLGEKALRYSIIKYTDGSDIKLEDFKNLRVIGDSALFKVLMHPDMDLTKLPKLEVIQSGGLEVFNIENLTLPDRLIRFGGAFRIENTILNTLAIPDIWFNWELLTSSGNNLTYIIGNIQEIRKLIKGALKIKVSDEAIRMIQSYKFDDSLYSGYGDERTLGLNLNNLVKEMKGKLQLT